VSDAVAIVAGIAAFVQRQRDALAIEIVAELQRRPPSGTPVRTGYARAMWVPILGQPQLATVRLPTSGTAQQRRAVQQSAAVSAAARQQAAIARLLATGPSNPTVSAHVYNPAPYVNRLNDPGHSPQSPAGWVERSVARAVVARRTAMARILTVL
jgi:hypothetical protein